jgi:hypothetical protein
MRSKLSFDTMRKKRDKVYAKRLKVLILVFYMHLVSAKDVLIFGFTLNLFLNLDSVSANTALTKQIFSLRVK